MNRRRLDDLLVERGLVQTRAKARALILAGQVLVNRQQGFKPGQLVAAESPLEIIQAPRYVSRGGQKLEAALDHFRIRVEGRTCLDVGASTGGFTDCLLQRGARRVYAVDVGSGQLDWKLRTDPRVVAVEGVNARHLGPEHVPEPVDLATCDVSFISVTLILPRLASLLSSPGEMVILVKPQFEVGRGQVGKGGVVRDPGLQQAACRKVCEAAEALGFRAEWIESPIRGAQGNREFLLYAGR